MNRKWLLVSVMTGVALVTGGWLLQRDSSPQGTVYQQARLFDDVLSRVADFYVDSIDERKLYEMAIDGMLDQLHDPYSTYLKPSDFRSLNEQTTGDYGGLGLQIEVRNGWITVRLEGAPSAIGYQHGYLLAPEIADALAVTKLNLTHDGQKDWQFFRTAAEKVLWPHIEEEYRQELKGIVDGLAARNVNADIWDIVTLNASIELGYYKTWYENRGQSGAQDRCSAFVATGSYTKDGRVVIGHNNWSGYLEGERWNIIFDLKPERGFRIIMDGRAVLGVHKTGALKRTTQVVAHRSGGENSQTSALSIASRA